VTTGPVRVAAYGYFGMGNIGNEGSLAALIAWLRAEHPEAEVTCFAADAGAVRREHGVAATQLMSFRANDHGTGRVTLVRKAASRLRDVPRTFTMMGDVDVLVVPGTGVLETKLVATPWGLPFWLFVAALSCRLRGRRVALVSVGAEDARHPITRALYRWTVRLATYCSYRDEESRAAVRAMRVPPPLGEVFPDLAFALPAPAGRPVRQGHVVIGVMGYDGDPDRPGRGREVRRTYVDRMAEVVTRLVDTERTVTLVVGDLADRGVAREIADGVAAARPRLAPAQVVVSGAETMRDIMREMSGAEVVVASRFHNLISALKLARPTVSLGYAEKSAHLLALFGLGEFSQGIDDIDVGRLVAQIVEVPGAQASVEPQMKETLIRLEEDLGEQFRRLSVVLRTAAGRRSRRRGARLRAGGRRQRR